MHVYHMKHPSAGDFIDEPKSRWPQDYQLVAVMHQGHLDTLEALELAFSQTQNIEQSWTENAGVRAIGMRHRSTSPGDVVALDDGNLYRCATTGWQHIGTTWAAKQEREGVPRRHWNLLRG